MQINGRLVPLVFRTWTRIGNNYVVAVGFDPMRYRFGLRLHWGRRDLLGETVREGETRFADSINWTVPVYWR